MKKSTKLPKYAKKHRFTKKRSGKLLINNKFFSELPRFNADSLNIKKRLFYIKTFLNFNENEVSSLFKEMTNDLILLGKIPNKQRYKQELCKNYINNKSYIFNQIDCVSDSNKENYFEFWSKIIKFLYNLKIKNLSKAINNYFEIYGIDLILYNDINEIRFAPEYCKFLGYLKIRADLKLSNYRVKLLFWSKIPLQMDSKFISMLWKDIGLILFKNSDEYLSCLEKSLYNINTGELLLLIQVIESLDSKVFDKAQIQLKIIDKFVDIFTNLSSTNYGFNQKLKEFLLSKETKDYILEKHRIKLFNSIKMFGLYNWFNKEYLLEGKKNNFKLLNIFLEKDTSLKEEILDAMFNSPHHILKKSSHILDLIILVIERCEHISPQDILLSLNRCNNKVNKEVINLLVKKYPELKSIHIFL